MRNSTRLLWLIGGLMALHLGAPWGLAQPVLTLEGSCPGQMTATVSDAGGPATVDLIFARRIGHTPIPPGEPMFRNDSGS